jgi:uncharacterized membrane protein (UPF0127 family)
VKKHPISKLAISVKLKLVLGLTACLSVLLMACGFSLESDAIKATDLKPAETNTPADRAKPESKPVIDPAQYLPIKATANIAGREIQLEVAETPQQQAQGLMFRPPLSDDRGMLFPFTPARPVAFWMKNTPSPLDMIFLLNGRVQAIARNATMCVSDPCPIYPESAVIADNVIEVRAGLTQELGLQDGDQVEIKFLLPKTQ